MQFSDYRTQIYPEIQPDVAVGIVEDIVLRDAKRTRDLPLKIYFPMAEKNNPVIIFSHGAGGSRQGFSHLGQFWAAKGYCVVHVTHPGTDTETLKNHGFDMIRQAALEPRTWVDRAQDISFIIDELSGLARFASELEDTLNPQVIGLGGHSLGAHTAALIAGARLPANQFIEQPLADQRVRAFLLISIPVSPRGTNRFGLNRPAWTAMRHPTMVMTGTEDQLSPMAPAILRQIPYRCMPAGDKYLTVLEGAEHSSYGDRGGESISGQQHQFFVRMLSILFWDAYLKESEVAKGILQSDRVPTLTNDDVTLASK